MDLRGVLLDLDGTLVDHEGAVETALRAWLPTIGVAATDEVVAAWRAIQERHLVAWRERRITFAEQRRRRLREFLPAVGVPFTDDAEHLDRVFAGYLVWYERSWRRYDDVDAALAAIDRAGLRTAVLTNGTAEQQTAKLTRVGLIDRVGPIFTAEELGVAKPDPGAFLTACQRWGLPAAAVMNVGDRHDLDVQGARAAGLRAIHLDRTGCGPADEPYRLASLRDLAVLLRQPDAGRLDA